MNTMSLRSTIITTRMSTTPHHDDEHETHVADEHDEHDGDGEHADAAVDIRYRCEHPDRLISLVVEAFATFERLAEVELRAVGPGGAVAESLERDSPRADLDGLFVE